MIKGAFTTRWAATDGKDGKDGAQGADGKAGDDGMSVIPCGIYDEDREYLYEDYERDSVIYDEQQYIRVGKGVRAKGQQPDISPTYWKLISRLTIICADTMLADNANIGGFIFSRHTTEDKSGYKYVNGRPVGTLKSSVNGDNGEPLLSMNGETGAFKCQRGTFKEATVEGDITATNGKTEVHLSAKTGAAGMTIAYDGVAKTRFTGEDQSSTALFSDSKATDQDVDVRKTNYISQYVSGGCIGNNQKDQSTAYDLIGESFTVKDVPTKVTFACNSAYQHIVQLTLNADGKWIASMTANSVTIEIDDSSGSVVYSETIIADYQTGESTDGDAIQDVYWNGCSLLLNPGTYTLHAYSLLMQYGSDTSDTLTVYSESHPYVVTLDPSSYKSLFFGNGFGFGTSALEHFQSVNEDGIQKTECLSGYAGFKVCDGALYLRIGGTDDTWYKCGRSSNGYLTLTKS